MLFLNKKQNSLIKALKFRIVCLFKKAFKAITIYKRQPQLKLNFTLWRSKIDHYKQKEKVIDNYFFNEKLKKVFFFWRNFFHNSKQQKFIRAQCRFFHETKWKIKVFRLLKIQWLKKAKFTHMKETILKKWTIKIMKIRKIEKLKNIRKVQLVSLYHDKILTRKIFRKLKNYVNYIKHQLNKIITMKRYFKLLKKNTQTNRLEKIGKTRKMMEFIQKKTVFRRLLILKNMKILKLQSKFRIKQKFFEIWKMQYFLNFQKNTKKDFILMEFLQQKQMERVINILFIYYIYTYTLYIYCTHSR